MLATPVGVIAEATRDGETGFIIENNSPKCIAENAKCFVEEESTFDKIVKTRENFQ
jgi:hypothetical protein